MCGRALLLACLAAFALQADSLEAFGYKWSVPVSQDWKVDRDGAQETLKLVLARPQEKPRRPLQFALAETANFERVVVEADVKRTGKSLIIVYAYRDEAHFNYAHISSDAAADQPVHNGIFHVYGGDRVRISSIDGPASLISEDWQRVKLDYDGRKGVVSVSVDGKTSPSLKGVDLSLGAGRVGIGSFFETGEFRNVKITGVAAAKQPDRSSESAAVR